MGEHSEKFRSCYFTEMMSFRSVVLPFFGMRTTSTVHVPFFTPLMVVPTNLQLFLPLVMAIRMLPCDCLGIFSPTDAAIFAALNATPFLMYEET